MSMETTCLKCRTVFRVTTEQLNAHQGDVRCGVCGTLFNAFDSLAPARTEIPPVEEKRVPLEPIAPDLPAPSSPSELPVAAAAAQEEMVLPEPVLPEEPAPSDDILPGEEVQPFADFEAALASEEATPEELQPSARETLPEPVVAEESFADFASAFEPVQSEPVGEYEEVAEANQPEPLVPENVAPIAAPVASDQAWSPNKSNAIKAELEAIGDIYAEFAKKMDLTPLPSATQLAEEEQASEIKGGAAEQEAKLQPPAEQRKKDDGAGALEPDVTDELIEPFIAPPKKSRGWLWGIAAFPLLVALAGQLAYYYRVDLAARYPVSRPLLERACAQIHCDVPLPRNADLLKIESSDLEADTEFPSRVTLSSVVSNRAAYHQAYPQLELTLTNHEDRAVARRIFTPKEYLAAGIDAQQGLASNSEVGIRLNIDLGDLNAVGYRLYVFYAGRR